MTHTLQELEFHVKNRKNSQSVYNVQPPFPMKGVVLLSGLMQNRGQSIYTIFFACNELDFEC